MDTNSTRGFHREIPVDLMKELTICESLATRESPYARAFRLNKSYGEILGDFLVESGMLKTSMNIMELGGGYGSLMKGLLNSHSSYVKKVFMIDLSLMLLKKQRERLKKFINNASFIQADIHELKELKGYIDLIIINEVIGDLDVATDLNPKDLPEDISRLVRSYSLELPDSGLFNLNLGAIKLMETICRLGVPAFLSEHSCDPIIPEAMPYLARDLDCDSYPREIRLHRHSEYTIRFSHLIKVANAFGKKVVSGALIDLLNIPASHSYRFIFSAGASSTDEQELIKEFLDHIREYRWLIVK